MDVWDKIESLIIENHDLRGRVEDLKEELLASELKRRELETKLNNIGEYVERRGM